MLLLFALLTHAPMSQQTGHLSAYARSLASAPALEVTYTSSTVGGQEKHYRLVLQRPNKMILESKDQTVTADGKKVTTFYKSLNRFWIEDQDPQFVASILEGPDFFPWRPYIDSSALAGIRSTRREGARTKNGVALNLVSAAFDTNGEVVMRLYLDPKDSLPRQAVMTNSTTSDSDSNVINVEALSIDRLSDSAFEFRPPNGSTEITEMEMRVAYCRAIIKKPTAVSNLGYRDGQIRYRTVVNHDLADDFVEHFMNEFTKYPLAFLQACDLREIVLVENLIVDGQKRGGAAASPIRSIAFDVGVALDKKYAVNTIHHEFYHYLEQYYFGSQGYKDPKWALLNPRDFRYKGSGVQARSAGVTFEINHPSPGFINEYCTYALEEDKAEVWTVSFFPEKWAKVRAFLDRDPIVAAKIRYLRAFAKAKCRTMDDGYWHTLTGDDFK